MALFCHPEHYKLGVMPMQASDIIEIDGLDELVKVDPSYNTYLEVKENEQK